MLFGFLRSIRPMEVLVLLITAVLFVWPAWRICSKAGFPGPWGLLAAVPVFNLNLLFGLAFIEWPAHRRGKRSTDS
ncbi:hypothetical protein SAMN05444166_8473 [Singulisphaera sp. GP187]|nr:hypothetical protein SAMN05444166_8473 [Singulisphaera sp. GP187]